MTPPTERSKFTETVRFLTHLQQHQEHPSIPLDEQLLVLRTWQGARLEHTYADFLTDKRFGPACSFFLSDIYAAQDFSQRDKDFEHIYNLMASFLPDFLLSLARNAIELNKLTLTLDLAILSALDDGQGLAGEINTQNYSKAYRKCDNYDERVQQIDLIVEIGRQVELGTRIPLVGMTLRLARVPAKRAGWYELHDFFDRGYKAFKQMRGADEFLTAIRQREMHILDKIYAGDPDPFDIGEYFNPQAGTDHPG